MQVEVRSATIVEAKLILLQVDTSAVNGANFVVPVQMERRVIAESEYHFNINTADPVDQFISFELSSAYLDGRVDL